jgi:hypothetical protein
VTDLERAVARYFWATEGDPRPERAERQAAAMDAMLAAAAPAYAEMTGRPLVSA